jgi:hypothetical protein
MSNFYMHKDGYFYSGDETEGAREATQEEIDAHLNPKPQVVAPSVNQDIADMYQAMLEMSARLEKLEGGAK